MKFKLFKTIWPALVAIAIMNIISCSNEDYFGVENDEKYITRSTGINYSEYLTISTTKTDKWTNEDFAAIDKAIERFCIVYSEIENRYKHNISSGEEINISDSLYQCIIKMIDYTNTIFSQTNETKITRMKTRAVEPSSSSTTIPDCVPTAISNMGKSAPTYEEAIKKCDELFPEWRKNNGVPYSEIKKFIEVYIPVTEYNNIDFCGEGSTEVPNYVTVIGLHAVNAYRISKISTTGVIYYYDYSSSAGFNSGFISASNLTGIFVFN